MSQPEPDVPRGRLRRHLVDLLVVLTVLVLLAGVAVAYIWLNGATGFECTPYHQALGHC
jgi:hypothetical protein